VLLCVILRPGGSGWDGGGVVGGEGKVGGGGGSTELLRLCRGSVLPKKLSDPDWHIRLKMPAAAKGPHSILSLFITTSLPVSTVPTVGFLLCMSARRPFHNILKCALSSVFFKPTVSPKSKENKTQNAPPILRFAEMSRLVCNAKYAIAVVHVTCCDHPAICRVP